MSPIYIHFCTWNNQTRHTPKMYSLTQCQQFIQWTKNKKCRTMNVYVAISLFLQMSELSQGIFEVIGPNVRRITGYPNRFWRIPLAALSK